jgi:hypothetical protein
MKKDPTPDTIRYLFDYREDGNLTRKIKPNNRASRMTPIGDAVGTTDSRGYKTVQVDGKLHKVHKLIYIYHNGEVPSNLIIDHIDGDPTNNRIENLRAVTQSQNSCNRKKSTHNKSGVKGVCRHKKSGKWIVGITYNKKKYHGGLFSSLEDAEARVKQLRKEIHGEYAKDE